MKSRKHLSSSAEKITIGILIVLVGINAKWAVRGEYSGPLFALFFYAVITFLCWWRDHFQAGIIGGVFGLGIHAYELIFQDMGRLDGIALAFFYANIVLPIFLMYFSYIAHGEADREVTET